jgi:hypothetical protein
VTVVATSGSSGTSIPQALTLPVYLNGYESFQPIEVIRDLQSFPVVDRPNTGKVNSIWPSKILMLACH